MIAVVGAGMTGLAVGSELARLGADFVVLEAGARAGGVVRSEVIEDRVVDWGPQRTRLTRTVQGIVSALDLGDEVVTAPEGLELFVYREGRLISVPFSVVDFLRSDVVSRGAKARLLLEPFTAAADPEERVSEYFRRKLGDEIYLSLVGPLYGGLYASDPADMQVGLSLGRALEEAGIRRSLLLPLLRRGGALRPPPACSFRDGMETLPKAMGRSLGPRLRLSTPVRALRRSPGGWRVEAEGSVLDAEYVVLCTPAPISARLLGEAEPVWARALAGLRYNPLAVVHLDADTPLRGLGFQVAFTDRDRPLRGVTFNDSLFGRPRLYTAYLGGALHPEVVDLSDADLARLAADEFRRCTGHEAQPLGAGRAHMPAWDMSWSALEDMRTPAGLGLAGNWRSRPGLPGRLAEGARVARAALAATGRLEAGQPA